MEIFSALLAICAGNSPVTGEKGQWRGALMFSLICTWIHGWVNNREAGDLRRYRSHYDVTVTGCGQNRPESNPNKTQQNINSLDPGKFEWNFRYVIFKQILVIDGRGISCEIALIWMSLGFTDDQSTLVQGNVDPDLCRHMASLGQNTFLVRCTLVCTTPCVMMPVVEPSIIKGGSHPFYQWHVIYDSLNYSSPACGI